MTSNNTWVSPHNSSSDGSGKNTNVNTDNHNENRYEIKLLNGLAGAALTGFIIWCALHCPMSSTMRAAGLVLCLGYLYLAYLLIRTN